MIENNENAEPPTLRAILKETARLDFDMASEPNTGALLKVLAASKPGGTLLEIGTGTGLSAAWILAGMDERSTLTSVDIDTRVVAVARKYLGCDRRVRFLVQDAPEFLRNADDVLYDFIFADSWAGKFTHLDLAIRLLRPGGVYVVDDLAPQEDWANGHASRVADFFSQIDGRPDLSCVRMKWASGLAIAVKTA